MEIKEMLDEVKTEVLTKLGAFTSDLDGVKSKFVGLQTQVDAIDAKTTPRHHNEPAQLRTVADRLLADETFLKHKSLGFRGKETIRILVDGGLFPISQKSTITDAGLGSATSGVLMPNRLPGLVTLAQIGFRVRDLLTVIPQPTSGLFDFVQQSVRTNAASPQVEAAAKAESTYSWITVSDRHRTIAHFTNVSRQALDDVPWLRSTIDSELMYGLLLKEETEILGGSGTGEHLNGLITQATAYDTSKNVAADTRLDYLRHAKLQARLAGLATYQPDGIVVHPADMAAIELTKVAQSGANTGLYIVGEPSGEGGGLKYLWNLPAVESDSITPGSFLVGCFGNGATLIDRMAATIDISFEHASNFVQNLATILCEERIGLAVKRPGSFIYGSFAGAV